MFDALTEVLAAPPAVPMNFQAYATESAFIDRL